MTEIKLSLEAALMILIGFVGLIITLASGYALLRERISKNELRMQYLTETITEMKQLVYELMNALNVKPRAHVKQDKKNAGLP